MDNNVGKDNAEERKKTEKEKYEKKNKNAKVKFMVILIIVIIVVAMVGVFIGMWITSLKTEVRTDENAEISENSNVIKNERNTQKDNEEDSNEEKQIENEENVEDEPEDEIDENEENKEVQNKVTDVVFNVVEKNQSYITVCGYDKDENVIWKYETAKGPTLQFSNIEKIGTYEDKVYINEFGTIHVLDKQTGKTVWKNDEYQGYSSIFTFGEDGTLYLVPTNGPGLFIVNASGKTLKVIDEFEGVSGVPANIFINTRNELVIYYDILTSNGTFEGVVTVDLKDYTYTKTDNIPSKDESYEWSNSPFYALAGNNYYASDFDNIGTTMDIYFEDENNCSIIIRTKDKSTREENTLFIKNVFVKSVDAAAGSSYIEFSYKGYTSNGGEISGEGVLRYSNNYYDEETGENSYDYIELKIEDRYFDNINALAHRVMG